MGPTMLIRRAFVFAALLLATSEFASGWELPKCLQTPRQRAFAEPSRDNPGCVDRHARAGNPLEVSRLAKYAYGPKYKAYYVGGSQTPLRYTLRVDQHPRMIDEGTWGTDYAPPWSRVYLSWTHGQVYQDGGGQYEPDHKNFPFLLRFGGKKRQEH